MKIERADHPVSSFPLAEELRIHPSVEGNFSGQFLTALSFGSDAQCKNRSGAAFLFSTPIRARQLLQILRHHVVFQIHDIPRPTIAQIRLLQRVRNHPHGKLIALRRDHR